MGDKTKESNAGWPRHLHTTIIPILLMVSVINLIVCTIYLIVHKRGNFHFLMERGILDFWQNAWLHFIPSNLKIWYAVGSLFLWAGCSILLLGGRDYKGPLTQDGFEPVYKDSGFLYYILTMIIAAIALVSPNFISAWHWYKSGCNVAATIATIGLIFVVLLWVKGHMAPSPGEHGSSGNHVFDFYWGMELYPRLGLHLDLKMWSNCRFGMMAWQLVVLICWKAQIEHSGWNYSMSACALLQTLYIAKFYWWEEGYMKSIDIILDRAGFYICWGCICVVPTFYTLGSLYFVENALTISPVTFALLLAVGIVSVSLNYWVDYQRQVTRSTGGKCLIWGKPARVVRAVYVDVQGRKQTNVLLASGFWGLSRHINYVFELCANLTWVIPAVEGFSILPFCHFLFLLVLLVHRSFRDDQKCQQKYGSYWEEYCRLVRYRILPFIF